MDFVIVFVVCILIFTLLTVALLFGRAPVYRPSKQDVLKLFTELEKGHLSADKWSLFIGIPIQHDPELEEIRQLCYQLELEAEDVSNTVSFGVIYRYNPEGMHRVSDIKLQLSELIAKEPVIRSF